MNEIQIELFRDHWVKYYNNIPLTLLDEEIQYYLDRNVSVAMACDEAAGRYV